VPRARLTLASVTGAGIEFDIVDLVSQTAARQRRGKSKPVANRDGVLDGRQSSVVEPVSCTVPVELVFESQAGAVGHDVAALQRVGAIAGAQVRLAFLAGRSHPSLAASCRTARALCAPAISFPRVLLTHPRQSRQPRACAGPVTQPSALNPGVRAAKDWSRL